MNFAMVFPGQGSQSVGMLQVYAGLPGIEPVRLQAEQSLGTDFMRVLDEGPAEALGMTVNTQPAMVTAGYAAYSAWRALGGPVPGLVAGHSLGEYTALVATGALEFGECLPLVRFRAESMQDAVPPGLGAMAAILNLDDDLVRAACAEAAQGQVVEAVNFNAPGQVVIAGHKEAVARAIETCKAKGARRAMPLPVSAPFHCALMQPAADKLRTYLSRVNVREPAMGLINNVDVAQESDPQRIRDALVRQAASAVRWVEIVRAIKLAGISTIIECGPGKVLSALVRRIDTSIQVMNLSDSASLREALDIAGGN